MPGVDRIVVRTVKEREKLEEELRQHQPWKAKPARRVYIPKANGKQRPLGIPVIKDRCLQTMAVQALEPEWEAKFEAGSYGVRLGGSCHDAIERICFGRAVERLWRSVKYENIFLKAYQNGGDLRKGLNAYFLFYNQERFHESLAYKTPQQVYQMAA